MYTTHSSLLQAGTGACFYLPFCLEQRSILICLLDVSIASYFPNKQEPSAGRTWIIAVLPSRGTTAHRVTISINSFILSFTEISVSFADEIKTVSLLHFS